MVEKYAFKSKNGRMEFGESGKAVLLELQLHNEPDCGIVPNNNEYVIMGDSVNSLKEDYSEEEIKDFFWVRSG